ncbi:SMI1/KNR4 family protein [Kribbella sp. CA-253562]|uniref:SMI1/KNR4 family protein n=1 Tax=Kribbella sp. CA-253562 TaxID=3239942 RepID=UPI003D94876C
MPARAAASWPRITGWLAEHAPATARLVNPPATPVDLRYLEAAMNRPLPADLIELLQLADGTEHRAIRGSVIPFHYNLVPVMDMLAIRRMWQKIEASPLLAGADIPRWLDAYLPIADAADAGVMFVNLSDGPSYGAVCEWYPEGGGGAAQQWSSVGQMLDDVAAAMVDRRPMTRVRGVPYLPEVDEGSLHWFKVCD